MTSFHFRRELFTHLTLLFLPFSVHTESSDGSSHSPLTFKVRFYKPGVSPFTKERGVGPPCVLPHRRARGTGPVWSLGTCVFLSHLHSLPEIDTPIKDKKEFLRSRESHVLFRPVRDTQLMDYSKGKRN